MNQRSIDAVAAARTSPHYMRPLYGSYCFSSIPGTLRKLLIGDPGGLSALPDDALPAAGKVYDAVVLIFLDAFGWRFFEALADQDDFLRRFARNGVVSKLTSQFPSTTAAHVTCMHTGMAPAQSGVYEWNQYEPSLDAMICPLPYTFSGERGRETLLSAGGDPLKIYPQGGMYQEWKSHGVQATLFQPRDVLPSTYGETLFVGSTSRSCRTLAEGVFNLGDALVSRKGRHYFCYYYGGFDTVMHTYGPDSPQARAELDLILVALERELMRHVAGRTSRTLLIVTADHGMAAVDPGQVVYLNQAVPALHDMLVRNGRGIPLVPAGSSRDFFLHIRPDRLADAQREIERAVRGRAEVRRVDGMIDQGYFGPLPASPRFLERVGNLVVLPYTGESVWWYERGRFEMNYRGMHGGLSPDEMETPFLAMELGE